MAQQAVSRGVDWTESLRQTGIGVLSGAGAGLVAGIGARIAMRIVALAAGQSTELSFATVGILILGILLGIVPGLVFTVIRKHMPGLSVIRGLGYGVLLLVVIGLPILLQPAEGEEASA